MCEENKENNTVIDNRIMMKNLYFYHKNNILLRIIQSLLSIYIGEGFFLFTEYNEYGYKIDEQLGYQIVFIPLCLCLLFSFFFTVIPSVVMTRKIKKVLDAKQQINLRGFNITILHLVIFTHAMMGMFLAYMFSNMVGEKNDVFILRVLIYSLAVGVVWGLMDYFSDMQISSEKFSNQKEEYSVYSKRKMYFYLYLITFLCSVIGIVIIFMCTMFSFDSNVLKQILYGVDNSGETGVYVFIATQLSLVVIYLKLAISRIHCENNVFFDFCEL